MNTSGARHQSLTRFTHLGPKSRCGAMTFSLDFGRGGIGIFGSRKSGSKCGESSPVDIRCAVFNGGIQYASPNIIGEKSDCGTSSFSPLLFYIATPSQAIDAVSQCDIIQESKMQTQSSPWLDKRLHFPFLKKGAMPSATDCPPTHNCTLKISYRTGGNNQLGPQEKAHQQFRHSAARNRAHRPVHSP